MRMLDLFLRRFIRSGRLTVIAPDGRTRQYGEEKSQPAVTIRLHDAATARRLALDPELALGEAYMDGTLTLEAGDIHDFLVMLMRNRREAGALTVIEGLRRLAAGLAQRNGPARARQNAAHHYDLCGALYDIFLDRDRQYSCAYFPTGGESLEAAQEAKKRHIAAKLLLKPGQRVLDIGCGWGGLALSLAEQSGARVHGVTLSQEQFNLARRRARERGLSGHVRFDLKDYREVDGEYDRIVSVGMFEHVGRPQYQTFFDTVARRLKPDGVALLHTIGNACPPRPIGPWIRKYIFPGGHIPSLSEIMEPLERSGLILTDVEVLRLHYADTLRHWRTRFMARAAEVEALYDARFRRMWEFYLAGAEAGFREGGLVVYQLQMARRQDAVPLTRDYITDHDRAADPVLEAAPDLSMRRYEKIA